MVDNQEERQELIRLDSRYYLVSRVLTPVTYQWETMIFPADQDGEVTDWLQEYAYRGYESIIDSVVNFAESRGFELSDVEGDLG